jgi:hypothetical protein
MEWIIKKPNNEFDLTTAKAGCRSTQCWADCQPHKSGDLHGQATKLPGEITVITTKKIGRRTEYTESVRHSCGHTIDYVTLGYKMERRQVAQKRQIPCGRCQLGALLKAPGNAQQVIQPDNAQ